MVGVLNAKNLAFSTPDANALMDYMCFYRSPLFPFFFFKDKITILVAINFISHIFNLQ